MYSNEKLLKEIIEFWSSNQSRILYSENPKDEYQRIQEFMWNEWSSEKLKENLIKTDYIENYQHRPTVEYYLGYHLYNSILKYKGFKDLSAVIENPKLLLRVYNESIKAKNSNLMISEESIKIWESNFK